MYDVCEEDVAVPVVERHVGRRADDDEHPLAVDSERVQHGLVRLEAGEVVLLLEAGVPANLPGVGAEPVEPILRDRVGHDHPGCRAAAERVLGARELVVVRVRRRDAERARDQRKLV